LFKKSKSYVSHVTNPNAQSFVLVYAEEPITENATTNFSTIKKNQQRTTNLMKSGILLRNGNKKFKHNKNALHAFLRVAHIF
jgi:hypothetical protein